MRFLSLTASKYLTCSYASAPLYTRRTNVGYTCKPNKQAKTQPSSRKKAAAMSNLQPLLGISQGLQCRFDFIQNYRIINGCRQFERFAIGDFDHGCA